MAEERLQKVIAQAGIASRREAEKMILAARRWQTTLLICHTAFTRLAAWTTTLPACS